MTSADDDLMNRPLDAVFLRCKLALLDAAFYEDVVAFVKCHRDRRQVPVERKTVPVRVLLCFAITIFERVAFAKAHIRYGRSGWQVAERWLRP